MPRRERASIDWNMSLPGDSPTGTTIHVVAQSELDEFGIPPHVSAAHLDQCNRLKETAPPAVIPGRLLWRPDLLVWQFEPEDCDALESVACNGSMEANATITIHS